MGRKSTLKDFVQAYSNNLPEVDSICLKNYFKNSDYLAPEMRNSKTERSTRPEYGDNAIGFVQLHRDKDQCTVEAEVTPETSTRAQSYRVQCVVKESLLENNEIVEATCFGCAASAGGCKHVVASIAWLHRRSEEPSVTSSSCYWKKSVLSVLGNKKFILAKEIVTLKKSLNMKFPEFKSTEEERRKFLMDISLDLINNKDIMFSDQLQRKTSLAVNHLMLDFKDEPTEQTARSFLKFSSEKMDSAICAALERKTIKQSKCPLWFDLHFGRVSASKLWEAAHCTTEDGTLRDSILGAKKFKGTKAMSDGLDLEPLVRKKVQRELNTKIKEAGMFMRSKYSIFGASPDGITETHVFEIKCPASASTFQTYFRDGAPEKEYMAQMQLQMLLTGRRKGYFCVAAHDFKDSGNVTIIEVKFDKAFLEPLLNAAAEFWIKYIFPILYK